VVKGGCVKENIDKETEYRVGEKGGGWRKLRCNRSVMHKHELENLD